MAAHAGRRPGDVYAAAGSGFVAIGGGRIPLRKMSNRSRDEVKSSGEIGLYKSWTGVDVDLTQ